MSAKLNEGDAAEYIRGLRTEPARRECMRYWKDKHGNNYVLGVMSVIGKRYPKLKLGLDGGV